MVSLQECDVPPIRPVMGHRHNPHWNRKVVGRGIVNGMMTVGAAAQVLIGEQDVATW